MILNNFSIIVCCYNSEKYISETMESLITQSYKNFEIIIINDGSTDNTDTIIFKYQKKYKNIIYHYHDNKGFLESRNVGIKLSKNEWIVILDHDDLASQDRLEIHNQQINENNKVDLFFGNCQHFDEKLNTKKLHFNDDIIKNYKFNNYQAGIFLLRYGSFIPSSSVVFSKKSAYLVNLMNTKYRYIGDYDFFIKIGFEFNISYTNKTLSYWRIHENQATKKMSKIYNNELLSLLLTYMKNYRLDLLTLLVLSKRIFFEILKKYFLL